MINAIADAEQIEVTDEEVQAGMLQALEGVPAERRMDLLEDESARSGVRGQIRQRRTIERLEQIALANYLANPEAAASEPGGDDDGAADAEQSEDEEA